MPFSGIWHTILDELDEVPPDGTFRTPLSDKPFRLEDVQEHRVLIGYREQETTIPLKREQFETLYERVSDTPQPFDLDRLPADAEPYATIFSVHPRFEIDQREGVLKNTDSPASSSLVDASLSVESPDQTEPTREEPDLPLYSDSLLLIDALERYDPTDLETMETAELVNLYTLCSDVQRNANDLRQNVRSLLLDRLHHDQPVHGQYGSVQRTSRRNRSLKDDETVLDKLEAQGIDRERVTTVDTSKVDEALEVTDLSESDLYEIDESQYVRKADVDEEVKESRLQGLKDQLAAVDEPQTEELQREIEDLEARIDELTSFSSATEFE
ncbi:DUF2800 domain-containing protein [Halohasta salina]|uniref:DUF2800 domain-containing protein n=1 Tax=Halohasta salina TaxID=2961621 RepID=UPI0020A58A6C|nr:DUF2800 domain-containing protein [Halohasta salina]